MDNASFLALTEGGGSEEKTKISNRNLKSYADWCVQCLQNLKSYIIIQIH